MYNEEYGKKLRELRCKYNYTKKEFCKLTNLSIHELEEIELGRKIVSPELQLLFNSLFVDKVEKEYVINVEKSKKTHKDKAINNTKTHSNVEIEQNKENSQLKVEEKKIEQLKEDIRNSIKATFNKDYSNRNPILTESCSMTLNYIYDLIINHNIHNTEYFNSNEFYENALNYLNNDINSIYHDIIDFKNVSFQNKASIFMKKSFLEWGIFLEIYNKDISAFDFPTVDLFKSLHSYIVTDVISMFKKLKIKYITSKGNIESIACFILKKYELNKVEKLYVDKTIQIVLKYLSNYETIFGIFIGKEYVTFELDEKNKKYIIFSTNDNEIESYSYNLN